jgi:hypothetical protein
MYASGEDWDICVTVRPTSEQKKITEAKRSWLGIINAGVIWVNNTQASRRFLDEWAVRTLVELNDQKTLNLMCQNVKVGEVVTIKLEDGTPVKVMGVPTEIYNNYYINGVENACIVHLKHDEWVGKTYDQLLNRIKFSRIESEFDEYYFDDSGIDLLDFATAYTAYAIMDTVEELTGVIVDIIDEAVTEIEETFDSTPATDGGS